jgi:hypothetical protein
MANTKISALTAATLPVAGTEVLPIVQSGSTVKLAISALTPGLSTITAAKGGTGQTVYAVGDLLYADTTTTLAKLPDVATGNALISGGVGVAPSWGKIPLTTHVSGVLPVANGGTNASSAGIAAFNNVTGYSASGATGTTSTNLVFSTSPTLTTPTLGAALATSIKFGSGSVLSAYEEGTWTPSQGSGLTVTGTFSSHGKYTRIGRQVTVYGDLNGTTISCTAAGIMTTNLPFSASDAYMGGIINNALTASGTCVTSGTNLYSATTMAATTTLAFSVTYTV